MATRSAPRAARTKKSPKAHLEQVAKKIRFLLNNESMSLRKLADRMGVQKEYLRDVLDARARPTMHLVNKLATVFDVKPEFFGHELKEILWEDPEEKKEAAEAAELAKLKEAISVVPAESPSSGGSKKSSSKRARKFDLAELAAHHQALLECLIEKKVISAEYYSRKLNEVRRHAKLGLPGSSAVTSTATRP